MQYFLAYRGEPGGEATILYQLLATCRLLVRYMYMYMELVVLYGGQLENAESGNERKRKAGTETPTLCASAFHSTFSSLETLKGLP